MTKQHGETTEIELEALAGLEAGKGAASPSPSSVMEGVHIETAADLRRCPETTGGVAPGQTITIEALAGLEAGKGAASPSPSSVMEGVHIETAADLRRCPETTGGVAPDQTITIGDMHGNAMKLIWILLRQGVIKMKEDDFAALWEIYDSSGLGMGFYQNTKDLLIDGFSFDSGRLQEFYNILSRVQVNNGYQLRLIGDVFSDRGNNDWLTMKVLEKLHQGNVSTEILASNHDAMLLAVLDGDVSAGAWRNYAYIEQQRSEYALFAMLRKRVIKHDELQCLAEQHILPFLKLFSYVLSSDEQAITLFMHAPNSCDVIRTIAGYFGVNYKADSAKDLAGTIDAINSAFARLYFEDRGRYKEIIGWMADEDNVRGTGVQQAFGLLSWNRGEQKSGREPAISDPGKTPSFVRFVVHGHVGATSSGVLEPRQVNLDNDFGKRVELINSKTSFYFMRRLPDKVKEKEIVVEKYRGSCILVKQDGGFVVYTVNGRGILAKWRDETFSQGQVDSFFRQLGFSEAYIQQNLRPDENTSEVKLGDMDEAKIAKFVELISSVGTYTYYGTRERKWDFILNKLVKIKNYLRNWKAISNAGLFSARPRELRQLDAKIAALAKILSGVDSQGQNVSLKLRNALTEIDKDIEAIIASYPDDLDGYLGGYAKHFHTLVSHIDFLSGTFSAEPSSPVATAVSEATDVGQAQPVVVAEEAGTAESDEDELGGAGLPIETAEQVVQSEDSIMTDARLFIREWKTISNAGLLSIRPRALRQLDAKIAALAKALNGISPNELRKALITVGKDIEAIIASHPDDLDGYLGGYAKHFHTLVSYIGFLSRNFGVFFGAEVRFASQQEEERSVNPGSGVAYRMSFTASEIEEAKRQRRDEQNRKLQAEMLPGSQSQMLDGSELLPDILPSFFSFYPSEDSQSERDIAPHGMLELHGRMYRFDDQEVDARGRLGNMDENNDTVTLHKRKENLKYKDLFREGQVVVIGGKLIQVDTAHLDGQGTIDGISAELNRVCPQGTNTRKFLDYIHQNVFLFTAQNPLNYFLLFRSNPPSHQVTLSDVTDVMNLSMMVEISQSGNEGALIRVKMIKKVSDVYTDTRGRPTQRAKENAFISFDTVYQVLPTNSDDGVILKVISSTMDVSREATEIPEVREFMGMYATERMERVAVTAESFKIAVGSTIPVVRIAAEPAASSQPASVSESHPQQEPSVIAAEVEQQAPAESVTGVPVTTTTVEDSAIVKFKRELDEKFAAEFNRIMADPELIQDAVAARESIRLKGVAALDAFDLFGEILNLLGANAARVSPKALESYGISGDQFSEINAQARSRIILDAVLAKAHHSGTALYSSLLSEAEEQHQVELRDVFQSTPRRFIEKLSAEDVKRLTQSIMGLNTYQQRLEQNLPSERFAAQFKKMHGKIVGVISLITAERQELERMSKDVVDNPSVQNLTELYNRYTSRYSQLGLFNQSLQELTDWLKGVRDDAESSSEERMECAKLLKIVDALVNEVTEQSRVVVPGVSGAQLCEDAFRIVLEKVAEKPNGQELVQQMFESVKSDQRESQVVGDRGDDQQEPKNIVLNLLQRIAVAEKAKPYIERIGALERSIAALEEQRKALKTKLASATDLQDVYNAYNELMQKFAEINDEYKSLLLSLKQMENQLGQDKLMQEACGAIRTKLSVLEDPFKKLCGDILSGVSIGKHLAGFVATDSGQQSIEKILGNKDYRFNLLVLPQIIVAVSKLNSGQSLAPQYWQRMQHEGSELLRDFRMTVLKFYEEVPVEEWRNAGDFSRDTVKEKAPHFYALIRLSTSITIWAVNAILSQSDDDTRTLMLATIIDLAHRAAFENNDYFTALALYNAVENSSVSRLSATWAGLPEDIKKKHESLRGLFSLEGNWKNLIAAMNNSPWAIPPASLLSTRATNFLEIPDSARTQMGVFAVATSTRSPEAAVETYQDLGSNAIRGIEERLRQPLLRAMGVVDMSEGHAVVTSDVAIDDEKVLHARSLQIQERGRKEIKGSQVFSRLDLSTVTTPVGESLQWENAICLLPDWLSDYFAIQDKRVNVSLKDLQQLVTLINSTTIDEGELGKLLNRLGINDEATHTKIVKEAYFRRITSPLLQDLFRQRLLDSKTTFHKLENISALIDELNEAIKTARIRDVLDILAKFGVRLHGVDQSGLPCLLTAEFLLASVNSPDSLSMRVFWETDKALEKAANKIEQAKDMDELVRVYESFSQLVRAIQKEKDAYIERLDDFIDSAQKQIDAIDFVISSIKGENQSEIERKLTEQRQKLQGQIEKYNRLRSYVSDGSAQELQVVDIMDSTKRESKKLQAVDSMIQDFQSRAQVKLQTKLKELVSKIESIIEQQQFLHGTDVPEEIAAIDANVDEVRTFVKLLLANELSTAELEDANELLSRNGEIKGKIKVILDAMKDLPSHVERLKVLGVSDSAFDMQLLVYEKLQTKLNELEQVDRLITVARDLHAQSVGIAQINEDVTKLNQVAQRATAENPNDIAERLQNVLQQLEQIEKALAKVDRAELKKVVAELQRKIKEVKEQASKLSLQIENSLSPLTAPLLVAAGNLAVGNYSFEQLGKLMQNVDAQRHFFVKAERMQRFASLVAQHIVLAIKDKYLAINFDANELISYSSSYDPSKGTDAAPNVRDFIKFCAKLSALVEEQIVQAPTLLDSSIALERWLLIAQACLQQGEMNSCLAIWSALNRRSVSRMVFIRQSLSPLAVKAYDDLQQLIGQKKPAKLINDVEEQVHPIIPLLSEHLTSLEFARSADDKEVIQLIQQKFKEAKGKLSSQAEQRFEAFMAESPEFARSDEDKGVIQPEQKPQSPSPQAEQRFEDFIAKSPHAIAVDSSFRMSPQQRHQDEGAYLTKSQELENDALRVLRYLPEELYNKIARMTSEQLKGFIPLLESVPATKDFINRMKKLGVELDDGEVGLIKSAVYIGRVRNSLVRNMLQQALQQHQLKFQSPGAHSILHHESTAKYVEQLNSAEDSRHVFEVLTKGGYLSTVFTNETFVAFLKYGDLLTRLQNSQFHYSETNSLLNSPLGVLKSSVERRQDRWFEKTIGAYGDMDIASKELDAKRIELKRIAEELTSAISELNAVLLDFSGKTDPQDKVQEAEVRALLADLEKAQEVNTERLRILELLKPQDDSEGLVARQLKEAQEILLSQLHISEVQVVVQFFKDNPGLVSLAVKSPQELLQLDSTELQQYLDLLQKIVTIPAETMATMQQLSESGCLAKVEKLNALKLISQKECETLRSVVQLLELRDIRHALVEIKAADEAIAEAEKVVERGWREFFSSRPLSEVSNPCLAKLQKLQEISKSFHGTCRQVWLDAIDLRIKRLTVISALFDHLSQCSQEPDSLQNLQRELLVVDSARVVPEGFLPGLAGDVRQAVVERFRRIYFSTKFKIEDQSLLNRICQGVDLKGIVDEALLRQINSIWGKFVRGEIDKVSKEEWEAIRPSEASEGDGRYSFISIILDVLYEQDQNSQIYKDISSATGIVASRELLASIPSETLRSLIQSQKILLTSEQVEGIKDILLNKMPQQHRLGNLVARLVDVVPDLKIGVHQEDAVSVAGEIRQEVFRYRLGGGILDAVLKDQKMQATSFGASTLKIVKETAVFFNDLLAAGDDATWQKIVDNFSKIGVKIDFEALSSEEGVVAKYLEEHGYKVAEGENVLHAAARMLADAASTNDAAKQRDAMIVIHLLLADPSIAGKLNVPDGDNKTPWRLLVDTLNHQTRKQPLDMQTLHMIDVLGNGVKDKQLLDSLFTGMRASKIGVLVRDLLDSDKSVAERTLLLLAQKQILDVLAFLRQQWKPEWLRVEISGWGFTALTRLGLHNDKKACESLKELLFSVWLKLQGIDNNEDKERIIQDFFLSSLVQELFKEKTEEQITEFKKYVRIQLGKGALGLIEEKLKPIASNLFGVILHVINNHSDPATNGVQSHFRSAEYDQCGQEMFTVFHQLQDIFLTRGIDDETLAEQYKDMLAAYLNFYSHKIEAENKYFSRVQGETNPEVIKELQAVREQEIFENAMGTMGNATGMCNARTGKEFLEKLNSFSNGYFSSVMDMLAINEESIPRIVETLLTTQRKVQSGAADAQDAEKTLIPKKVILEALIIVRANIINKKLSEIAGDEATTVGMLNTIESELKNPSISADQLVGLFKMLVAKKKALMQSGLHLVSALDRVEQSGLQLKIDSIDAEKLSKCRIILGNIIQTERHFIDEIIKSIKDIEASTSVYSALGTWLDIKEMLQTVTEEGAKDRLEAILAKYEAFINERLEQYVAKFFDLLSQGKYIDSMMFILNLSHLSELSNGETVGADKLLPLTIYILHLLQKRDPQLFSMFRGVLSQYQILSSSYNEVGYAYYNCFVAMNFPSLLSSTDKSTETKVVFSDQEIYSLLRGFYGQMDGQEQFVANLQLLINELDRSNSKGEGNAKELREKLSAMLKQAGASFVAYRQFLVKNPGTTREQEQQIQQSVGQEFVSFSVQISEIGTINLKKLFIEALSVPLSEAGKDIATMVNEKLEAKITENLNRLGELKTKISEPEGTSLSEPERYSLLARIASQEKILQAQQKKAIIVRDLRQKAKTQPLPESRAHLDDVQQSVRARAIHYFLAAEFLMKHYNVSVSESSEFQTLFAGFGELAKEITTLGEFSLWFDGFVDLLHERFRKTIDINDMRKQLMLAENLLTWEEGRAPVVTLSSLGETRTALQIDEPSCHLTLEQIRECLSIFNPAETQPDWFKALPLFAQNYLRERWKDYEGQDAASIADRFNAQYNALPASLRSLPGTANRADMRFVILDSNRHEVVLSSHMATFATPLPIDVAGKHNPRNKQEEARLERLTRQNILQEIEEYMRQYIREHHLSADQPIEIPVIIQSLLSPSYKDGWVGDNDTLMVKMKEVAIDALNREAKEGKLKLIVDGKEYTLKPVITTTNHPLNALRRGRGRLILRRNEVDKRVDASIKFLTMVLNTVRQKYGMSIPSPEGGKHQNKVKLFEQMLSSIFHTVNVLVPESARNKKMLMAALRGYIAVNEQGKYKMISEDEGLFRAAFEAIITESVGGLRVGGCKSGKDRQGVLSMWIKAMYAFYTEKGYFPNAFGVNNTEQGKEDRELFIRKFIEIFKTQHVQTLAGQNAPGVNALKSLRVILPNDIRVALEKDKSIGPQLLALWKGVADLNKPKKAAARVSHREALAQVQTQVSRRDNEIPHVQTVPAAGGSVPPSRRSEVPLHVRGRSLSAPVMSSTQPREEGRVRQRASSIALSLPPREEDMQSIKKAFSKIFKVLPKGDRLDKSLLRIMICLGQHLPEIQGKSPSSIGVANMAIELMRRFSINFTESVTGHEAQQIVGYLRPKFPDEQFERVLQQRRQPAYIFTSDSTFYFDGEKTVKILVSSEKLISLKEELEKLRENREMQKLEIYRDGGAILLPPQLHDLTLAVLESKLRDPNELFKILRAVELRDYLIGEFSREADALRLGLAQEYPDANLQSEFTNAVRLKDSLVEQIDGQLRVYTGEASVSGVTRSFVTTLLLAVVEQQGKKVREPDSTADATVKVAYERFKSTADALSNLLIDDPDAVDSDVPAGVLGFADKLQKAYEVYQLAFDALCDLQQKQTQSQVGPSSRPVPPAPSVSQSRSDQPSPSKRHLQTAATLGGSTFAITSMIGTPVLGAVAGGAMFLVGYGIDALSQRSQSQRPTKDGSAVSPATTQQQAQSGSAVRQSEDTCPLTRTEAQATNGEAGVTLSVERDTYLWRGILSIIDEAVCAAVEESGDNVIEIRRSTQDINSVKLGEKIEYTFTRNGQELSAEELQQLTAGVAKKIKDGGDDIRLDSTNPAVKEIQESIGGHRFVIPGAA